MAWRTGSDLPSAGGMTLGKNTTQTPPKSTLVRDRLTGGVRGATTREKNRAGRVSGKKSESDWKARSAGAASHKELRDARKVVEKLKRAGKSEDDDFGAAVDEEGGAVVAEALMAAIRHDE